MPVWATLVRISGQLRPRVDRISPTHASRVGRAAIASFIRAVVVRLAAGGHPRLINTVAERCATFSVIPGGAKRREADPEVSAFAPGSPSRPAPQVAGDDGARKALPPSRHCCAAKQSSL